MEMPRACIYVAPSLEGANEIKHTLHDLGVRAVWIEENYNELVEGYPVYVKHEDAPGAYHRLKFHLAAHVETTAK